MNNKIKRPDYDDDFDFPEGIEDLNEREELESRARNTPHSWA